MLNVAEGYHHQLLVNYLIVLLEQYWLYYHQATLGKLNNDFHNACGLLLHDENRFYLKLSVGHHAHKRVFSNNA